MDDIESVIDDIESVTNDIGEYLRPEDGRVLSSEERPFSRVELLRDFYVDDNTPVSNEEFLRIILQERRILEKYRQLLSRQVENTSENEMKDDTTDALTEFLEEQVDFLIDLAVQNLVVFVTIFLRLPIEYGKTIHRSEPYVVELDNISVLQEYKRHGVPIKYYSIIDAEAGNIAEYLVIRGEIDADILYKYYIEEWSKTNRHITRRFCSVIYHILQYTTAHTNILRKDDSYVRKTIELYETWNPLLSLFDVFGLYAADERRKEEAEYDPHFTKLVEVLLEKHGVPQVKTKICWSFFDLVKEGKYETTKTLLNTNAFDLSGEKGLVKEALEYGASKVIDLLLQHGAPLPRFADFRHL